MEESVRTIVVALAKTATAVGASVRTVATVLVRTAAEAIGTGVEESSTVAVASATVASSREEASTVAARAALRVVPQLEATAQKSWKDH